VARQEMTCTEGYEKLKDDNVVQITRYRKRWDSRVD
jgi:hypothetical protein